MNTGVKDSPLLPGSYIDTFSREATRMGFREETFARIGDVPLKAFTKRQAGIRPRIYLSAGIHGDEPAAPLALLRMLQNGRFDNRATWFLCPLLNPEGFLRGQRESASGRDLNRDYLPPTTPEIMGHVAWLGRQPSFDVTICLHEDWESQGFYLYELNPDDHPSLAETMLKAAGDFGPIEQAPIIDGRPSCGPGLIRPVSDPLLRETWPEAIYLLNHHTRRSYTLESPSALDLDVRIAMQIAAVDAALTQITEKTRGIVA